MEICKTVGDISWPPHPIAKGVNIKLYSGYSPKYLNLSNIHKII